MKLIVGLGNPGEKYQNSRHNLGFMVAEALLKDLEPVSKTFWDTSAPKAQGLREDTRAKALIKDILLHGEKILLAKPQTFVNNSGISVSNLLSYYKIKPEDLIVVYDDLDLPFGRVRVRFGGAAGGHNGVKSIIDSINSDKFLRVRIGIGHPHKHDGKVKEGKSTIAVEDYVIANFTSNERGKIKHSIKEATRAIHLILEHGIEKYMSKYNNVSSEAKEEKPTESI